MIIEDEDDDKILNNITRDTFYASISQFCISSRQRRESLIISDVEAVEHNLDRLFCACDIDFISAINQGDFTLGNSAKPSFVERKTWLILMECSYLFLGYVSGGTRVFIHKKYQELLTNGLTRHGFVLINHDGFSSNESSFTSMELCRNIISVPTLVLHHVLKVNCKVKFCVVLHYGGKHVIQREQFSAIPNNIEFCRFTESTTFNHFDNHRIISPDVPKKLQRCFGVDLGSDYYLPRSVSKEDEYFPVFPPQNGLKCEQQFIASRVMRNSEIKVGGLSLRRFREIKSRKSFCWHLSKMTVYISCLAHIAKASASKSQMLTKLWDSNRKLPYMKKFLKSYCRTVDDLKTTLPRFEAAGGLSCARVEYSLELREEKRSIREIFENLKEFLFDFYDLPEFLTYYKLPVSVFLRELQITRDIVLLAVNHMQIGRGPNELRLNPTLRQLTATAVSMVGLVPFFANKILPLNVELWDLLTVEIAYTMAVIYDECPKLPNLLKVIQSMRND
jgi:hypothetical protein